MKSISKLLFFLTVMLNACSSNIPENPTIMKHLIEDSIQHVLLEQKKQDSIQAALALFRPENIEIEKDFLYNKYTLEDTYPYKDTVREFQWGKIRAYLAFIDSIQMKSTQWGILKNRRNINGEASLAKNVVRNAYRNMSDTFGVERYQSVPLYFLQDTIVPERYGRDGFLVKIIENNTYSDMITIWVAFIKSVWKVPRKYVHLVPDTVVFHKIAFVDVQNQNIATLEKNGKKWLVRSMNPATTGANQPPVMYETPLGIFVVQEKKQRMIYLKDGSTETGGFAPFASRFCNGAYIHGVPVNAPHTSLIEFSTTLGTIPRSHMCVRNATSHAEFVYNWMPVDDALVIVLK